jgi:hypothetical protein
MFIVENSNDHGRFVGISEDATGSNGRFPEDMAEKGA